MRCSQCGLPLSPSRTHCPRCGTAITKGSEGKPAQMNAFPTPGVTSVQQQGNPSGTPVNIEAQQRSWANSAPPTTPQPWAPAYQPVHEQIPFPATQAPFSNSALQGPQNQIWLPAPPATPSSPSLAPAQTRSAQYAGTPNDAHRRKTLIGFSIAGLLVITGGLLLAFVYVMALGLPTTQPDTQSSITTPTSIVNTSPTTPGTTTDTTPTVAVSPTATYPGQQYIDKAQTASSVDTKSAQPIQVTTTFKPDQQIFVTFSLHPAGHSGAVCLLWYLNNKQFSHYEFEVGPTPLPAYSYINGTKPGTGYVELYWASTKACTDKVLAQRADFTVSA